MRHVVVIVIFVDLFI